MEMEEVKEHCQDQSTQREMKERKEADTEVQSVGG